MQAPALPAPTVVLDTNAVLDWLVFGNAELRALGESIVGGSVRWVASAPMREELAHVLSRGHLDRWSPDAPALWAHWARHCTELPAPPPAGPRGRLRCSDPDDQKFIDFAVFAGARWLVSRDRAVLKLARRLREHGVVAIPPGDWRMG